MIEIEEYLVERGYRSNRLVVRLSLGNDVVFQLARGGLRLGKVVLLLWSFVLLMRGRPSWCAIYMPNSKRWEMCSNKQSAYLEVNLSPELRDYAGT